MAAENRATNDMCLYCFDSVIGQLNRKNFNAPKSLLVVPPEPLEDYPCTDRFPLFVTWKKRLSNKPSSTMDEDEYHLRGCIGTFSPLPLSKGLREYAITAAFKDYRFDPIIVEEVPKLKCGVSLLVNFEELSVGNVYDWDVGTHGIRIAFEANGRGYNGTYLPEVAPEQEWTREETVSSLIRKTGYKGRITQSLLEEIEIERYQSSKVSLTYDEYVDLKMNGYANKDNTLMQINAAGLDDLED